jgi:hypothetical protein
MKYKLGTKVNLLNPIRCRVSNSMTEAMWSGTPVESRPAIRELLLFVTLITIPLRVDLQRKQR